MFVYPKKAASNLQINQGSVLLLFNDIDTEIVRSWRVARQVSCQPSRSSPF